MKNLGPMLAATIKVTSDGNILPDQIRFPVYVSPKLDGIRALVQQGCLVSRTLKPIPNQEINTFLSTVLLNGLDGELILPGSFHDTSSYVMSAKSEGGNWQYHVFDWFLDKDSPYESRQIQLAEKLQRLYRAIRDRIELVPSTLVHDLPSLLELESKYLELGYEGIMLRSPTGLYKGGRSTLRQGFLSKLKRFQEADAQIIGFQELFSNHNEAHLDELGYTKRSQCQDNCIPMNTLGAFRVQVLNGPFIGQTLNIGTGIGLIATLRKQIWDNQSQYLGRKINFTYQAYGSKDVPRLPIYRGFRT